MGFDLNSAARQLVQEGKEKREMSEKPDIKTFGIRGESEDVDQLSSAMKTLGMKGTEQIKWLRSVVATALCMDENPGQADQIAAVRGHLDAIMAIMTGSLETSAARLDSEKEQMEKRVKALQEALGAEREKRQAAEKKLEGISDMKEKLKQSDLKIDQLKADLAAARADGRASALQEFEGRMSGLMELVASQAEQIGRLKAEKTVVLRPGTGGSTERLKAGTGISEDGMVK